MTEALAIVNDYANFSKKSTCERYTEYQLHCHSCYELYYFISGDVKYMVEGKTYLPQPNSILLLKPNAVHGVMNTSSALYCRYTFHFMPNLISAENRELLYSPFYSEHLYFEHADLEPFFDSVLASETLPGRVREIALSCRFEALLTELYRVAAKVIPKSGESDNLAMEITSYIGEHLKEDLRLEDIAKAFFISKSHLNRLFRKDLDTTVGNYIGLKRASIARQLLLQGETAAGASVDCGFKDYSTFFRTYKKFIGHAPTAEASILEPNL
ncbi:MAG: AraC family transcriptional regulator [Oscillospiraceae bacterium]